MIRNSLPRLLISSAILLGVFFAGLTSSDRRLVGQTQSGSSEGILPSKSRETRLERELRRLKDAESVMGEAHPKMTEVRKRIAEVEAELRVFRSVPNPFVEMQDKGVAPTDIVDRLNEKELRTLVVRLAVDIRDLQKRVTDLETILAQTN